MSTLPEHHGRHSTEASDDNPAVTVVVPVHGTEGYIQQCLSSLLSQDFADFEVIVVDDATPDNAMTIVERMAGEDHRIKILRHPNCRGLGAARNTGIAAAKGKFLAFVDSDDFVPKNFLSIPLEIATQNNSDIIEFGYTRVDEKGLKQLKTYLPTAPAGSHNFLHYEPSVCIKFWRREFLMDYNFTMPEGIKFEDLQFTTQAITVAQRIDTIHHSLYMYRMRDNSIIKSYNHKDFLDYLTALSNVEEFLTNENLFETHKKNYDLLVWRHLGHASSRARRGGSRLTAIYIKAVRTLYWLTSQWRTSALTTAAILRWEQH